MPIHDWTKVTAGTWHAFHLAWIAEIQKCLNGGLLPADYYAQAEQIIGPFGPDVLTLQLQENGFHSTSRTEKKDKGPIALKDSPPLPRMIARTEADDYLRKRRTLTIRHTSDDQIIAIIELLSPGNKASHHPFQVFLDKVTESIYRGYHLLLVDLFPPTKRDPDGIHAAIWSNFADCDYHLPMDAQLTLAAYSCGTEKIAFVENTSIGRVLIPMPLFLEPEVYVNVPLEETYQAAFAGMPKKYQEILKL